MMLKGLFIFESGGFQQIGEVNSLQGIINTIQILLPQLIEQEQQRVLGELTDEQLAQLMEARKNKKEG